MPHVHRERHGFAVWHVLQIRLNNEPIPRWNGDGFLDVSAVVLHLIIAHAAEVDVRLYAHAADGHQLAAFHGLLQRQSMRTVAE